MRKFFEKKIIIGSVLGFFATAIGIIALFFPSLFNLEKEKMSPPVAKVVNRNEDLVKLFYILEQKDFEKQEIFKLDIALCRMQDVPMDDEEWYKSILHEEKNSLTILYGDYRPKSKSTKPTPDEYYKNNSYEISYRREMEANTRKDFGENTLSREGEEYLAQEDVRFWAGMIVLEGAIRQKYVPPNAGKACGEDEGILINGYFMPIEEYSPHAGEDVIVLKNVPDEQLKVKNY